MSNVDRLAAWLAAVLISLAVWAAVLWVVLW